MCLETLIIKSNLKNYKVYFDKTSDFIIKLSEKENTLFIIDENVWNLYKETILFSLPVEKVIILQISEENKNINTVCLLYEKIMKFAPRKNLNLISIGGGIIQDITGFVASSLYRGINWIFIPTTFLAQVDSCIGAKTSLNFNHYKNLIGTFYPPSEIHIYPEFLKTLTKEDFYSGVGEMAKLHLMKGEKYTKIFINSLEKIDQLDNKTILELTQNCLKIKKSYIENDEFDNGKRNMLNYGHCFGHAIESATDFGISHGQAVILGMIIANMYSAQQGKLTCGIAKYINDKVLKPIIKFQIPKMKPEKVVEAMRQDKKNTGNGLALIMLKDNYEMEKVTDLKEPIALKLLQTFISEIASSGGGGEKSNNCYFIQIYF